MAGGQRQTGVGCRVEHLDLVRFDHPLRLGPVGELPRSVVTLITSPGRTLPEPVERRAVGRPVTGDGRVARSPGSGVEG